ncbi:MAG: histidine phosphatase family protein [Candidatus Brocadiaceae bacterium]|nr:histidine phosphatase family protein [Candidatus Brocadiaceae bacterium]
MGAIYSNFEEAKETLMSEEENVIRFIFTRHGRTYLNAKQVFQPWTPQGDQLNEEGMVSAKNLGKKLRHIPIQKIYSSDWHRAVHTAQLINEERIPPLQEIHLSRGLRDFNFGALCGVSVTSSEQAHPALSEIRIHKLHEFKAPEGDTFTDFHHRIKDEFMRIFHNNSKGNILVVSHSYVAKCLIIAALNLPLETYANTIRIKNTSLSVVELKNRQIPGRLLILNDT